MSVASAGKDGELMTPSPDESDLALNNPSLLRRFFRAMSSLNPVELYAVCFVFGAGLGSLARVFFVLFVLLRRSHAYLNEPTATASSSVAAARVGAVVVVNERDAKDQEEKSGLIANVDADDDEELPAYQERSVTARH